MELVEPADFVDVEDEDELCEVELESALLDEVEVEESEPDDPPVDAEAPAGSLARLSLR